MDVKTLLQKLEQLSMLSFSEAEKAPFEADLAAIIAFADAVKGAPMPEDGWTADAFSGLRADDVQPSESRERILQNAKGQNDGFFAVSSLLQEDGG